MGIERLAQALIETSRRQAQGTIAREVWPPELGVVRRINPLTIQPQIFEQVLTEEVLRVRKTYTPKVGDEVLLVPTGYGEWVVVDGY